MERYSSAVRLSAILVQSLFEVRVWMLDRGSEAVSMSLSYSRNPSCMAVYAPDLIVDLLFATGEIFCPRNFPSFTCPFDAAKMRQLKHHEQRLLKHVDFLNYKQDQNHRDLQVIRRYHIQNREDYFKYLPRNTQC